MRLTIFSRLVFGYLTLFCLVLAISVYAIVRLRQMDAVTKSILTVDSLLNSYNEKLTDTLLDQARNEKKFIILKDRSLYDRFLEGGKDFQNRIVEALTLPLPEPSIKVLEDVRRTHSAYGALLAEEASYFPEGSDYPQEKYTAEKERLVNRMVKALASLKDLNQRGVNDKIQRLDSMGEKTRRAATLISWAALLVAVIISIVITRSITTPVFTMKAKASRIAAGDLEGDLKISSPPEMEQLARAMNYMCGRLKEIDKMKSDFFSLMSHELRTPLTSIKEGTNLLLEGVAGDTSERQKRLLTILSEESNRLIELVSSLLAIAKMEAGMMRYSFEIADIDSLVKKVIREMEPLAVSRQINIENRCDSLPRVRLDNEKMLQVLRNLMGNAIKFTPEGGMVTVKATKLRKSIRVEVSDTGPGLTESELVTVFDRYRQASANTSSRVSGTGLGLSIVKNVIKAHGGKVWAESSPGRGSTFIFLLPF